MKRPIRTKKQRPKSAPTYSITGQCQRISETEKFRRFLNSKPSFAPTRPVSAGGKLGAYRGGAKVARTKKRGKRSSQAKHHTGEPQPAKPKASDKQRRGDKSVLVRSRRYRHSNKNASQWPPKGVKMYSSYIQSLLKKCPNPYIKINIPNSSLSFQDENHHNINRKGLFCVDFKPPGWAFQIKHMTSVQDNAHQKFSPRSRHQKQTSMLEKIDAPCNALTLEHLLEHRELLEEEIYNVKYRVKA